ncbi:MAG TPA: RNA 2',3'-cyclic phosphodiesterase [Steroidobacteraceae bacterium]|nr:RNA 2',3'-cyclic phosphodiesterase [Steroidobacteraceae bacterium]
MRAPEHVRRLFFALWPTTAMQAALLAAARGTLASLRSGRPVACENLHLTLAFVGSVPESLVRSLEETARGLSQQSSGSRTAVPAGAALDVSLDAIEYWPRSEILCAAASHASDEAAAFAETLKQALLSRGFAPDLKPFRAHVTLARQVRGRPLERTLRAVMWRFTDFALVESHSRRGGSLYSVVASWPLYSA